MVELIWNFMQSYIPKTIQDLIDEFAKMPGIGPKTASRLVFYLISRPKDEADKLGQAVINVFNNLQKCDICKNISDSKVCVICSDKNRDEHIIAVVEHPLDVVALEKTGEYNGLYHVLGGSISPVEGIGPDDIYIQDLFNRLKNNNKIKEIILATNPNLEGEATAMYIQQKIGETKIKLTRIARGLPIGGDLEYADEMTLGKAIEGRREID